MREIASSGAAKARDWSSGLVIPGARLAALDGRNHLILESEPAWSRFLDEVASFPGSTDPADGLGGK